MAKPLGKAEYLIYELRLFVESTMSSVSLMVDAPAIDIFYRYFQ